MSIPEGVGVIISRGYTYSPLYMGLEVPSPYYWNLVMATITRMDKRVVRILLECFLLCWLLISVDLRGPQGMCASPWGSKFLQFHAVFGKIWQNRMLAPPPSPTGLALPPRGNPGSATEYWCLLFILVGAIINSQIFSTENIMWLVTKKLLKFVENFMGLEWWCLRCLQDVH